MQIDFENIVPKICIGNKQIDLNGIDIIEGFAKFQEAMFANIYFDIPVEDTINPNILNKEYYIALAYFIQELGIERIMEFPLVCDLALQTTHLSWPKNAIQWKDNHPAWRFLQLVKALQENPEINLKAKGKIEDIVSHNMNRLLQICGFKTLDKIWDDTLIYLNNGEDLLLATEMKRAIQLKQECPWILAYPFLNEKDYERITDFHPVAYNFMNKTEYPDSIYNDELWGMETVFENHLQAFVRQVWGEVSKYSLYSNEIQCGFTYFNLKGCPYFKQGKCSGSIKCDEGLQVEAILDEKENIAKGCSFGLFLLLSNINLENVDYEEVNTNITLEGISQKMKELKKD